MNIQISNLHPNSKTLACRLIDATHTGRQSITSDSLDDIQKRFLTKNGISYSFDHEANKWEIIIKE